MKHPIPFREPRIAGHRDAAHASPCQRIADRERSHVRAHVTGPRPHVRIDGEVGVANEELTLGRIGDRRLHDLEEPLTGEPGRVPDETDLATDTLGGATMWSVGRAVGAR